MSATQVHSDPEKMRAFASELDKFAHDVKGEMERMKYRLGRLGETWRDDGFRDFVEQFKAAEKNVREFVAETEHITPQLKRDAEALDNLRKVKL